MRKIRVLIVEDSAVVREHMASVVGEDGCLEVAAAVPSAEEALLVLDTASPDVIALDIHLPGMDGFEATRRIMSVRPTPIVIVSAAVRSDESDVAMRALEAGALAVLEKPVGSAHQDFATLAGRLRTQLRIMSEVKVVRQYGPRLTRARALARETIETAEISSPVSGRPVHAPRMLAIAASTGGPQALARILRALPPDIKAPIVVVQHMTTSFVEAFAAWLATVCALPVSLVRQAEIPKPANVYLAGPGLQLRVEPGLLVAEPADPGRPRYAPGTVLFDSMAKSVGCDALGVLLTGMGDDGAAGLLRLRTAGGHTIAEHRSTAVVYGMPAAAVRIGAVCELLPLSDIVRRVSELLAPVTQEA